MAEHDYAVANDTGANVRADINNALAAIVSNNSKATAPSTTFAYQWWADTGTGILKQRNAANSAWISILTLATGVPIAGAGIASLAADTTPQLGGDLDLNSNDITGTGGIPSANLTGQVAVAKGGTGAATHTANNVLVGNGTSAITSVAPSTSGNVLTSTGSAWASSAPAGGGKILQCVSATKNDTTTITSSTFVDISGLSVTTGTLASTSSRLYIHGVVYATQSVGNDFGILTLVRGSTEILLGDAAGSRSRMTAVGWEEETYGMMPFPIACVNSPSSTSAQTIKIQGRVKANSFYINRTRNDADNVDSPRVVSTLTVMEIA